MASASMAQDNGRLFMPIGGGYADTLPAFGAAAVERASGDVVKITVLPITYATDAETISAEELTENLDAAEGRREQVAEACAEAAPEGVTCDVQLAPVFVRTDALNEENLAFFPDDLAAVYILGGDQTIAMKVVAGTPIESALQAAYERGALIGGTSAGLSVQSRAMIGGYLGDFGPESGLNAGAVDLWNSDEQRGLAFGLTNVILEQHFWERGRLPRLLNALAQPDAPRVGVGVDTYTAAQIRDETLLTGVAGLYNAIVLDAETLGSGGNARFENDILSIKDVLFHLLAPGEFSYDLTTRIPSMSGSVIEPNAERFADFALPADTAPLIVAGNLADALPGHPALVRLSELAGGADGLIVVLAAGYASEDEARAAADAYAAALGTPTMTLIASPDATIELPPGTGGYSGILVTAPDQSALTTDVLRQVAAAWRSGKALLLDNAAAGLAGAVYAAQGPTPEATDDEPDADVLAIQNAFLQGTTPFAEGLGLLPFAVEPRLLDDYRWGRLVALAYEQDARLALGLSAGAAVEFSGGAARALGTNGVVVLDLRQASLGLGTNNAYTFANGLLDVFAPGEALVGG
ncbi:MAG: Type 1 glutamine amidotransferase-like domain-containing protein [Anaerolineae bacterium]|nr:Type 1 glutamine amidotransferase-like domain-containing protein [Anaerolineae bacterium]